MASRQGKMQAGDSRHKPATTPQWLFPATVSAAVLLLLVMFSGEVTDPDFWWHLKTGQYIWQNHALPVPDPFAYTTLMGKAAYPGEETVRLFNQTHEWLAQAALYAVYTVSGFPGIIVVRQLLLCAMCGMVGLVVFRRCDGLYRSVFAALATGSVALFVARDRPYLVTFLLVAVTLAVLEYRRWMWLLPPLLLLWANSHAGFFLGWVVLGAYCAEALFLRWRGRPMADERRLLLVTVAAVAASMLNPNGLRVLQVLLLYRSSPLQSSLVEWSPPIYWEITPFTVVLYAAAGMAVWARARMRVCDWILLALFSFAALTAVRNIVLVGIIGPVIIASHWPWKQTVSATAGVPVLIGLVAALGWQCSLGYKLRYSAAEWNYPAEAADFLLAHRVTGRIFNTYDHGGYLMWRLWPQEKVFQDGRALNETVYADSVRIAYNAGKDGNGLASEELLRKYGIEVIVMPLIDRTGGIYLLPASLADSAQQEWKLVFQSTQAVIYMRTPPGGVEPINPLMAFSSMESQCRAILDQGGYSRCARSVSELFARIGEQGRASAWARIYREHADRSESALVSR